MKTHSLLFLSCLISLIVCSCSPWKQTLVSQGTINDAVENAIEDFVHTSKKLLRDDKVFGILVDTLNKNIVYISILGVDNMILLANENTKPGRQDGSFPTNYKIVDGKLFYWYDPDRVITEELLNVLQEYDHIYYQRFEFDIPEMTVDDAKKAAGYYFCINNLTHYKKIVASRRLPKNHPPKMKCK